MNLIRNTTGMGGGCLVLLLLFEKYVHISYLNLLKYEKTSKPIALLIFCPALPH